MFRLISDFFKEKKKFSDIENKFIIYIFNKYRNKFKRENAEIFASLNG